MSEDDKQPSQATRPPVMDKPKYKVTEEAAEKEFTLWAEAMDMDLDTKSMDESDINELGKMKNVIVREIKRGHAYLNTHGELVYTPHRPASKYTEPITFHERTGASILAMDKKKEGQNAHKMYAMLSQMTGLPVPVFSGLAGTDIKFCEAVFALLMD